MIFNDYNSVSKKIVTGEGEKWVNVSGSSEKSPKCNCDSWKNHWKNFSGCNWPTFCSVLGCTETAILGAHVRKSGTQKQYIAPFCNAHNNTNEEIALSSGVTLVNANQSETCA